MKRKRHTVVYRMAVILLAALTVSFGAGILILKQLEQSNMNYIYQLTKELVNASITQLENEFSQVCTDLYEIVVSDEIQKAGSTLLANQAKEEESAENTRSSSMARSAAVTAIVNGIGQKISANHSIVCANFLDLNGSTQVIAATSYYRLNEEAAERVRREAVEAKGSTIFLEAAELTGDENILIAAKLLREKKGLSLAHIGVVVLFVDMNRLGEVLTDAHDAIYVLQNEQSGLQYILNSSGDETEALDVSGLWKENREKGGYFVRKAGNTSYFVAGFKQKDRQFSYLVLTPYEELFSGVRQVFRTAMVLFILCSLFVLAASFGMAHRINRDLRQFISHIHHIPWENFTKIPLYENDHIGDKDIYELQRAFNSMSVRINELVRENYMKQLLIKETQLSALQAQMNPHFLYNTLNSIYWMAKKEGVGRVAEMINSLSLLLREAVSADELVIDLDKELNIVCHYVTIQKQRYGERLQVEFDVSDTCSNLIIPKFTLQPLLENAIAYGVECMLAPCMVTVRIFTEDRTCICQVMNNGPAPEKNLMEKLRSGQIVPRGNGVGLLNIDKRLKAVFGEEYGINVYRMEEKHQTVVEARFRGISMKTFNEGKANEANV